MGSEGTKKDASVATEIDEYTAIAGNFHQEKNFANFATWSCWRNFCPAKIFDYTVHVDVISRSNNNQ